MDKIDKKLITLLQNNARMPLKALAENVFLSSPAVSARIERLEKEEIIEGYGVKINQIKLGYHITAFINLEDSDVTIEMERFLYEVARSYQECFRVYGSKKSFEWQQLSDEDPVLYERTGDIQQEMIDIDGDPDRFARGGEIIERRIKVPDYGYRLPEEIAFFTTETVYNDENEHLSFKQGGGHGGSHPHMIHEFIMSIVEDRKPLIDDIKGAYWTATGICAHLSAMEGGKKMPIPDFAKLD